jgi:hypothetical protein
MAILLRFKRIDASLGKDRGYGTGELAGMGADIYYGPYPQVL